MIKTLTLPLLFVSLFTFAQRTVKSMNGPSGTIGFYQFLPPGYNSEGQTKHPLIIFLHGIGEKGTGSPKDLQKLNCCGLPKYINHGHTMQFTWNGKTESFVVLYPQLYSRYGTWENYYVDSMIRYAKDNLRIDTNRIFLTGLSLGGGASWVYPASSLRRGKQLAGIVPVVSPCFMMNGCNIANANLPVLTIHAWDDDKASPYCTINAVKSINNCGASFHPSMIIYNNGGHYVWRYRAYDTGYIYFNPNVYEWMLAQNRKNQLNIRPVARAGKDITVSTGEGEVTLDGTASADADGKIVRYVWQKVSGPSYDYIAHEISPKPVIKGLTYPGVYTYQLRVIDDRAEWSTDSVRITVVDGQVLR
ncbi:MAG TPA: PKD domain-containing protein [Flavitalea sp.]|nr:PKD domain-containing protein [Flavitalea sp.]